MKLTRYQNDTLYDAVKSARLPMQDFEILYKNDDSKNYIVIAYVPNTTFEFQISKDESTGLFSIALCNPSDPDYVQAYIQGDFETMVNLTKSWVDLVRQEVQYVDPWASFSVSHEEKPPADNEVLNSAEREDLQKTLDEIKRFLAANSDKQDEVLARLIAIERNMEKIGKKDLYLLASGAMLDLAKDKLATSENAMIAWQMLSSGFEHARNLGDTIKVFLQ